MKKNTKENLRDFWDNIKIPTFASQWFYKVKREKVPEKIFEETITENFPNMGKETLTQVEEEQRIPYKINPRRNITRHAY